MRAYLILLILILPLAGAQQSVTFDINPSGVVEQDVRLSFEAEQDYGSYIYRVDQTPAIVEAQAPVRIEEEENGTVIFIEQAINIGPNEVAFTLVQEGLVERQGSTRIFGVSVQAVLEPASISVTLPRGFALAETSVPVSPEPDAVETDGERITFTWEPGAQPIDIIVIYEGPGEGWRNTTIIVLVLGVVIAGLYWRQRRKRYARMDYVLGSEEKRLVELLREEERTQKELCKLTGFSKSKMSKVVRKLEEKRIIEKEPYFKTNKIRIEKEWR